MIFVSFTYSQSTCNRRQASRLMETHDTAAPVPVCVGCWTDGFPGFQSSDFVAELLNHPEIGSKTWYIVNCAFRYIHLWFFDGRLSDFQGFVLLTGWFILRSRVIISKRRNMTMYIVRVLYSASNPLGIVDFHFKLIQFIFVTIQNVLFEI